MVERVNGRLKDDFGARHLRVRVHKKVYAHLMFGVLALCVKDQIVKAIVELNPSSGPDQLLTPIRSPAQRGPYRHVQRVEIYTRLLGLERIFSRPISLNFAVEIRAESCKLETKIQSSCKEAISEEELA